MDHAHRPRAGRMARPAAPASPNAVGGSPLGPGPSAQEQKHMSAAASGAGAEQGPCWLTEVLPPELLGQIVGLIDSDGLLALFQTCHALRAAVLGHASVVEVCPAKDRPSWCRQKAAKLPPMGRRVAVVARLLELPPAAEQARSSSTNSGGGGGSSTTREGSNRNNTSSNTDSNSSRGGGSHSTATSSKCTSNTDKPTKGKCISTFHTLKVSMDNEEWSSDGYRLSGHNDSLSMLLTRITALQQGRVWHLVLQGSTISSQGDAEAVAGACRSLPNLTLQQVAVHQPSFWPLLASSCTALHKLALDWVDSVSSITGRKEDHVAVADSFSALATGLPALQQLEVQELVHSGDLLLKEPEVGGNPVVSRVTALDTEVNGSSDRTYGLLAAMIDYEYPEADHVYEHATVRADTSLEADMEAQPQHYAALRSLRVCVTDGYDKEAEHSCLNPLSWKALRSLTNLTHLTTSWISVPEGCQAGPLPSLQQLVLLGSYHVAWECQLWELAPLISSVGELHVPALNLHAFDYDPHQVEQGQEEEGEGAGTEQQGPEAPVAGLKRLASLLGPMRKLRVGPSGTAHGVYASMDEEREEAGAGADVYADVELHDPKQPYRPPCSLHICPGLVSALQPMARHLTALHLVGLPTSRLTPDLLRAMGAALGPHLTHLRLGWCDHMPEPGSWGQLLQCLPKLQQLDVLADSGPALDLPCLWQACRDSGRAFRLRAVHSGTRGADLRPSQIKAWRSHMLGHWQQARPSSMADELLQVVCFPPPADEEGDGAGGAEQEGGVGAQGEEAEEEAGHGEEEGQDGGQGEEDAVEEGSEDGEDIWI